MIEIEGIGPRGPIMPEDIERERLKEIKTRLGKIAFAAALGRDARISNISNGIARSEGALKWIEEVFRQEKWKNS